MIKRLWQYLNRFASVYFYALPGGYTDRKIEILKKFYEISNTFLHELGVDYWLAYGTLLGYYREKGILKHDIDLDYGAPESSFDKIWNNKHLLPRELRLYNTSFKHRGPKLFFSYKGFDADIYFYEEKGDRLEPFLISSIPADMQALPVDFIYPLQPVDFLGLNTFVPAQSEKYLEHCYGYIGTNAIFDKQTGYWHEKK